MLTFLGCTGYLYYSAVVEYWYLAFIRPHRYTQHNMQPIGQWWRTCCSRPRTTDNKECQTPKDHKISHVHCPWSQQSAEDGTLHNTNDSSNLSDIFAQCGRTINPLLEDTLSAWLQLAGTAINSFEQVSKGHKFHLATNVCKLCVTVILAML